MQVASAQQTDAPAGPTPGLRPTDEQANFTALGQAAAGVGAAGKQAAVGGVGEGLAMQPPAADAIPADATHTSADSAAQPSRKRSRKHRDLEDSGTASCNVPQHVWACHVLVTAWGGCDVTWASYDPAGRIPP